MKKAILTLALVVYGLTGVTNSFAGNKFAKFICQDPQAGPGTPQEEGCFGDGTDCAARADCGDGVISIIGIQ